MLKKFIWCLIKFIFIVATILIGVIIYAYKVEPYRLITREYHIDLPAEGKEFVRVVQFSDVHLGPHYSLKQLQKLVDRMNELEPDIIVFTGDLMDVPSSIQGKPEISSILAKLTSKYGKYAVWGNHDYGGGGVRFYDNMMEKAGFKLLKNQSSIIKLDSGNTLTMIGLDDALLGHPNIQKAYTDVDNSGIHIFLSHEPDLIDRVVDKHLDLALAGHSHGGQVDIPLIGPLITPPFATTYKKGMYKLADGKHIYVNSGIGTTRIPVRFWDPPEIAVFNLNLS